MKKIILFLSQDRRRYDYLFIAIIIFVVAYKFQDLFLPYFWDELGVYSQAAYYQYLHGVSLMPASVPPLFSRGHPLLFTFCNALVFKFFGPDIFCIHLFNLSVALCLLVVLYRVVARYFNPAAAVISCAFLAVQPVFLAQSCLVLPEIMLSLLAFSALVCFYEGKYFLFSLFSILALLTKETAIIIPAVALVYAVVNVFIFRKKSKVFNPANIFCILYPYVVFGIFLLLQKQQNGWYLFPHHADLQVASFENYRAQFCRFFDFIFLSQERRPWLWAMIAGVVVAIYRKRLPSNSFLLLLVIFIIVFILFSSFSYYMERYNLVALVSCSVIAGVSLSGITKNSMLTGLITLLLCAISLQDLETDNFNYDADMGYRTQVTTLKKAIDYVVQVADTNKYVYANFPGYYALNFPQGGYLDDQKIKATLSFDAPVDYFLYCSPGDEIWPDTTKYKLKELRTLKNRFIENRVYRLEKK